jgi:hypothetical protein
MSLGKLTAGIGIASALAYIVYATIDAKYGISYQLAQKLP